jgi:hypothetical protein
VSVEVDLVVEETLLVDLHHHFLSGLDGGVLRWRWVQLLPVQILAL